MSQTPHPHEHFTGKAVLRDIVIGMSDGLTVPFALAAGLSGTIGATGIVVTAGLAEVAAGSIAMGLGGYLAAWTDAEHYATAWAAAATLRRPPFGSSCKGPPSLRPAWPSWPPDIENRERSQNPRDRVAYLRFEMPNDQKQIGLALSSAEWESVRNQVDRIFVDKSEARA